MKVNLDKNTQRQVSKNWVSIRSLYVQSPQNWGSFCKTYEGLLCKKSGVTSAKILEVNSAKSRPRGQWSKNGLRCVGWWGGDICSYNWGEMTGAIYTINFYYSCNSHIFRVNSNICYDMIINRNHIIQNI